MVILCYGREVSENKKLVDSFDSIFIQYPLVCSAHFQSPWGNKGLRINSKTMIFE